MYTKAIIACALPLLGSTLAAPAPQSKAELTPLQDLNNNLAYTVMALRSASPIHFLPMTAHAGGLYLGGQTETYCPDCATSCPPGNQTVFKGSCSLNSQYKKGGQTLWNTDDGVIGYSVSNITPEGAYNCPWYLANSTNSAFAAELNVTPGADGFVACPTNTEGLWQVLRDVGDDLNPPQGHKDECLGFTAVAINYTASEYGAWLYL